MFEAENLLAGGHDWRVIALVGLGCAVVAAGIVAAAMGRRLSRQNVLLDVALNNMTHGLMMFDAAGGLILFNQRYVDLYRLPAGAIRLGMTMREVIDLRIANGAFNLDADAYCRDVLASIRRGEVSKQAMEMEDGRTIAVTGEPLASGGWIATHQDITEEKRREASFRFLFDENPLPMWVWDHETLGFLAVNKAAVEKYGYDRERFRSLTLRDIKRSPNWDIVNTVAKGDSTRLTEGLLSQHAKADGSLIDVEIYGRSLVYEGRRASLAAPVDVTQRKRIENELRGTREFYNTVLESVPSAIAVKDVRDKKYIFVNRAAEEHFGMTREQAIGKTAQELFPPKPAAVIEGRDQDLVASGVEHFYDTHAIPTAHMGKRYITSRRVLIRDEKAEARYLLSVIDDVTDRKQQEDELRRTRTFLDSIVENVPAMLTVKDAHDLRYALVNRAAEQLFGLTRDEIVGKTAIEVFPRRLHRPIRHDGSRGRRIRHAARRRGARVRAAKRRKAAADHQEAAGAQRRRQGAVRADPVGGHHGPQAGARPDRPHGAARYPHGPAEPRDLQREARERPRERGEFRQCVRDPERRSRPLQGSQRRLRARGRRRAAVRGRAAARRGRRRARSWRGSAATNSR